MAQQNAVIMSKRDKKSIMFQRFVYLFAAVTAVCACAHATGPVSEESLREHLNDTLPERWTYISEMQQEVPSATDGWWRSFGDSTLDSLITLGIDYNYNLAMTMKRTAMARNAMMQARSGWMPVVGLSAGWSKSRSSGAMTVPSVPATVESGFTAGVSAQWEIDIFGKIAAGVKAKKAAYNASRAEYAGAMVSLCAQIASTYVNLRMYQAQMRVTEAHIESQLKTVNIARARYEATLASKLDVDQAEATYYATVATLPQYQYLIHTAINSLEVLTGTLSESLRSKLSEEAAMPDCMQMVSAGVPADILRRRPDIAQAELELAEYAAEAGVAKKDFLPTLVLEGNIGTSAHDVGDLFSHNSFTYSIAPTLSWTIFDGLSRKYALASAREQLQAGIDNYNQVVATAYEETDNALASYHFAIIYKDEMEKVLTANVEALKLAMDRYKNSLSPMLDVVNSQINTLSAEQELLTAQGRALSSLISLYEALGGGFDLETLNVNLPQ